ncbi:hypothetical protein [Streptomyces mirabilis]|uniref:hypothetical protein n=1 Tax=Streptomyces mirabilis TaxID=68239 RepID=UPI0036C6CA7D
MPDQMHPMRRTVTGSEDRYNVTAQPFQCKFTTAELNDLLTRLDRHTLADRQEGSSVALAV